MASVKAYGNTGRFVVYAYGLPYRINFESHQEAQKWIDNNNIDELKKFYWPCEVLWGDDYDPVRRMKFLFANSKEEALNWVQTRLGRPDMELCNIFQYM